jgi:sugar lactone lactonase YvrE
MAFITDSSGNGPNAIIVVDLASGRSVRRLDDHPSMKASPGFIPFVEGQPLMQRTAGQPPRPITSGADGIAIDGTGTRLYYCALGARRLYSVSLDALANEHVSEADVAATIIDHGEKGASDGLEADEQGHIYVTNYEQNGIGRWLPDGTLETLVHDPRALWPDTLAVATDGYLYFTANQLHRQARFHNGVDQRERPFSLFRVKIDGTPVRLR